MVFFSFKSTDRSLRGQNLEIPELGLSSSSSSSMKTVLLMCTLSYLQLVIDLFRDSNTFELGLNLHL